MYKVHIFANIINYAFYRVRTSCLCLIKMEQLIFQKNRTSCISNLAVHKTVIDFLLGFRMDKLEKLVFLC